VLVSSPDRDDRQYEGMSAARPPTTTRTAVQALLDTSAANAWTSAPGKPSEVLFLRALFDDVVRNLDTALSGALAAFGLSSQTRGVFVHGRPVVDVSAPGARPGCEIGDLLTVVHNADGPRPAGKCAAVAEQDRRPPPVALRHQRTPAMDLYDKWPTFWWRHRFARGAIGGDGRRHVQPAGPHLGAQYLTIDPVAPRAATFEVAMTSSSYRAGRYPRSLADAFVDTMLRTCGRRFCDQATAHGRIGWDRVIWDLIESFAYTAAKARSERYSGFDFYCVGGTPPLLFRMRRGRHSATPLRRGDRSRTSRQLRLTTPRSVATTRRRSTPTSPCPSR